MTDIKQETMTAASESAELPVAGSGLRKRKRVRRQKQTPKDNDNGIQDSNAQTPTIPTPTTEAELTNIEVKHEPVDALNESEKPKRKRIRKAKKDDEAEKPAASFTIDTQGDTTMIDAEASTAQLDEKPNGTDPTASSSSSSSAAGAGYLNQETLNYYKQLAEVLDKDEFETDEDRSLFLANVVEELCGAEAGQVRMTAPRREQQKGTSDGTSAAAAPVAVSASAPFILQRLCSHTKCSRLIQRIMEVATRPQVQLFLHALGDNAVGVLSDRCGSHVLESVLFRLPTLLLQEEAVAQHKQSNGADESDEAEEAPSATPIIAPMDPAAEAAALLDRQKRLTQAWRNIGTHSTSSLVSVDSSLYPLRSFMRQLIIQLSGQWPKLSLNTHASFMLRHIIHLLMGEKDIRSVSESAASRSSHSSSAPSSSHSSSSSNTATSTTTLLPSYLDGLEECLPFIGQELLSASTDEFEELSRNGAAVPVLQSIFHAMEKLAQQMAITGSGDTEPSEAGEKKKKKKDKGKAKEDTAATPRNTHANIIRTHAQSLAAKLLQFKGSNPEEWTLDNCSQTTKNHVFVLMTDRSGSRLVESICQLVGGVDVMAALFECHLKGRLMELAQHPIANFCVQHILGSVQASFGSRGRHMLRDAYEELSPNIEQLCVSNRGGVVLKLLDACMRVQVKENKLFKLLWTCVFNSFDDHTAITDNVVAGFLLAPILKHAGADTDSISVIGSLMVQAMLLPGQGLQQLSTTPSATDNALCSSPSTPAANSSLASSEPFNTVLNAFLLLPNDFVVRLALDPAGSHLFDAFIRAPCATNVKHQMLRRFQLRWVELAVSNHGSYVLERLFTLAPNKLKVAIAGDLCRAEKRVTGSKSGSLLFRKLRLEHFKKHQPSWLSGEELRAARARLFDDVLEEKTTATSTSTPSSHTGSTTSATTRTTAASTARSNNAKGSAHSKKDSATSAAAGRSGNKVKHASSNKDKSVDVVAAAPRK